MYVYIYIYIFIHILYSFNKKYNDLRTGQRVGGAPWESFAYFPIRTRRTPRHTRGACIPISSYSPPRVPDVTHRLPCRRRYTASNPLKRAPLTPLPLERRAFRTTPVSRLRAHATARPFSRQVRSRNNTRSVVIISSLLLLLLCIAACIVNAIAFPRPPCLPLSPSPLLFLETGISTQLDESNHSVRFTKLCRLIESII